MEDERQADTARSIKTVVNAINSVQKIVVNGMELVVLPKQKFDDLVSVAELLYRSDQSRFLLEHKIALVAKKEPDTGATIETLKNPEALLTQKQVADEWGISGKALEKWRVTGGGPPYVKLGKSRCAAVRYRRKDIEEYVQNFTREHTTQHSNAK